MEQGGNACAALNAANEVAVDGFLNGKIGFLDIAKIIEKTLEKMPNLPVDNLQNILENDQKSRQIALELLQKL